MHVVVTGGGTGGHIFPALEIIKELREQDKKIKITYVGNKNSMEQRLAKEAGINFLALNIKQMVGKSMFKKILALIYLKLAVIKSCWFLLLNRPKAVIGVGGYVSAPMIIASFLLGIKRSICEQNVVPGLTNRALGYLANHIFISFKDSEKYFPKHKVILSGNPIRKDFFSLSIHPFTEQSLKILVTGGSQGAHVFNTEVPKVLAELLPYCPNLSITHQTGLKDVQFVKDIYEKYQINAKVTPFIDHMPTAFRNHNLLISRAGATVCAEIAASGMPAVLIPYPYAGAHQKDNAEQLLKTGAAFMVLESPHLNKELFDNILALHKNPHELKEMSIKAKTLSRPKASFVIASTMLQ